MVHFGLFGPDPDRHETQLDQAGQEDAEPDHGQDRKHRKSRMMRPVEFHYPIDQMFHFYENPPEVLISSIAD
jgi:hypothetical protein